MHDVPFVPKARRDQNRASDGLYLRNHFTGDTGFIDGFPEECLYARVIRGIADRIEFYRNLSRLNGGSKFEVFRQ